MKIIKETKDYIILNKPAGLVVHGDGRSCDETLADILIKKKMVPINVGEQISTDITEGSPVCKLPSHKYLKTILKIYRPGIVHRLDKDTSGIMIVAKNPKSFLYFKTQFKKRRVIKNYKAIVWGKINKPTFAVSAPIARSTMDFRKYKTGKNTRGEKRDALTNFRVIKSFEYKGNLFTYLEASPKTGRTHQIRVHLAHIGNPIVSDSLYAEGKPEVLGFKRPALHAHKIYFKEMEGEQVSYEAEMPEDFKKALALVKL